MGNKKKLIRNVLFLILMIIITFGIIFKNNDFNEVFNTILKTDYRYVILAGISMFMYIFFEAVNIRHILSSLKFKINILNGIKYTLIGFFGSGITPGGGGGQPLEIYYMKKDGIKVSASMITLLIEICAFHIITIFFGLLGLVFNYKMLSRGFIYIFIIGLIVKLIVLILMLIGLFNKKLTKKLVDIVILITDKIKYFNTDKIKENITSWMEDYNKAAIHVKTHKKVFIDSIFFMLFQVFMHYSVSFFVYKSFGFNEYNYLNIVLIQAVLYVATASIPLPGAVGISETAFLIIYSSIFGNTLTSAMLIQRFITFYLFMIIALIVFIFSTYSKKKIKY